MANTKQSRGKSKGRRQPEPEQSLAPIAMIILFAGAVLLFWLSVATPEANTMVSSLQSVLIGLTGQMTWVLPVLLLWLGIYQLVSSRKNTYSPLVTAGSVLLALLLLTGAELLACPTITQSMNFQSFPNFMYNAYLKQIGGGAFGALAWILYRALGVVGGMIVVVALILVDAGLTGRRQIAQLVGWLSVQKDGYDRRAAKRREERELNDMFDPYEDFQEPAKNRTRASARSGRRERELFDLETDELVHEQRNRRRQAFEAAGSGRTPANFSEDRPRRQPANTARPLDDAADLPPVRSRRPSRPEDGPNLQRPATRSAANADPLNPLRPTVRPAANPDPLNPLRPVSRPAPAEDAPKPQRPAARNAGDVPPTAPRPEAPRYYEDVDEDVPEYRPERQPNRARPASAAPAAQPDAGLSAIQRKRLRDDSPVSGDDFAGGHTHTVHGESYLKGGSVHVSIDPGPRAGIGMPPVEFEEEEPFVPETAEIPMTQRDLTIVPDEYEQPDEDAPFDVDEEDSVFEPDAPAAKELGIFHKSKSEPEEEAEPYNYPPLDLLAPGNAGTQENTEDIDLEKAQELEDTLRSFNIEATMSGIAHGPAVTRFEFKLPRGVKVGRITSLADDIAYNLAAESVRIEAPIPGKTAVGVEIPNDHVESVPLRDVLESSDARHHNSRIAVGLGKDNAGRYIVADIAKMPHVLIAGQTGSGKSVCINSIIMSILYRAAPEEVKLILIDPKVVELSVYNEIPHLIAPVVTDPKKAASALEWAVTEMGERYKKFSKAGVRNIKGYNSHLPEGEKMMPQIVIIIDELADLMMAAPGEVEDSICRLAQLARAAGMHLVIATQRPSVNVITGLIKANIPSRIAFKVASTVDSRTIFDHGGAEKLLGNGDMLYVPSGISKPMRVQGAWVSDEEVENVVEYIKSRHENKYDEDVIEHMNRAGAPEAEREETADDECDDRLAEAVEIVIDSGQASISMLQRKMRVGYARAGRLIDEMCRRGIVSEADGSKPRSVLITKEQFHNAFSDD